MKRIRIIYLHGYGSTGQSGTVDCLRKQFPDYEVIAPDIDTDPFRALCQLRRLCRSVSPDLIIGTSQGAMYAMQMAGYKRICVNPALRMSTQKDVLKTGTFPFFQPRADGRREFTITRLTIFRYRIMEALMYLPLTREDCESNVFGLFGDADTTVNFREEWDRHFPWSRTFRGAHRMNNSVIRDTVVPLAKEILAEVERNLPKNECLNGANCSIEGLKKNHISTRLKFSRPVAENTLLKGESELDAKGGKYGVIVFPGELVSMQEPPEEIIRSLGDRLRSRNKLSWCIGRYFSGWYVGKGGKHFYGDSLAVAVSGADDRELFEIAEEVCRDFRQGMVLLKRSNGGVFVISASNVATLP